jgi:Ca2+-binding RTX toxin-like protein
MIGFSIQRLLVLPAALLVLLGTIGAVSATAEEQILKASDGDDGDFFGWAVAVDNDMIVIAAPNHDGQGAVYIYEPDGSGGFTETELTASDGVVSDRFGTSVAAAGGMIVVGAQSDDDMGAESGSVYVYEPDGLGGYVETKLTASDGGPFEFFGNSVDVDGSTIVVGAPFHDLGVLTRAGATYRFVPDGLGGYVETKITASDAAAEDTFGGAVGVDGSSLISGSPQDDDDGISSGAAYLYQPDGLGGFDETKLTASDAAAFESFGFDVDIDGSSVLVGSPGTGSPGAVYLYQPDGAGGFNETKIVASDGISGDEFGYSVDLNDGIIAVGAPWVSLGAGFAQGAVYLYHDDGAGGFTETKLVAASPSSGDWHGWSVAVSVEQAVGGAPADGELNFSPGMAHVFTNTCGGREITVDIGAGDLPTSGDDVIAGTSGDDVIDGLGGDDVICGFDGDDTIRGGDGGDIILGGDGTDGLRGDAGDDVIFGQQGPDFILGNAGDDRLFGDNGADEIYGGSGFDEVEGGLGNDTLGGGGDADEVRGEEGDDVVGGGGGGDVQVSGGPGDDVVRGGGGNDSNVRGNGGDDTVAGNGGDDVINGDGGADMVFGGNGDDIVNGGPGDDFLGGNDGVDVCNGGSAGETVGDTAAVSCETVNNVP